MSNTNLELSSRRLVSGLNKPLFVTAPPNDEERLFIVEQNTANIKIFDLNSETLLPSPFLSLDSPDLVTIGNEQGLLGLTFHPQFSSNGKLYIAYTAFGGGTAGNTRLVEYQINPDNPNLVDLTTARTILSINQPQSNHNGGWIGFGPDDYLYWGVGDGGGSDDNDSQHTPGIGNSQDITDNLLGKILRLDVDGDDFPNDSNRNYSIPPNNPFVAEPGDDEIWAFGLRNPWRSSFDRLTGDLYIADVGQNNREEINFQPASSNGGENYGWRLREGTISTPTGGVGGSRPPGAVDPFYEYDHSVGRSITGGYVYRGDNEVLDGTYFFADFISGNIWSLRYDGVNVSEFSDRTTELIPDLGSINQIASFGEDGRGNLYIVDLDGEIFQIQANSEPQDDNYEENDTLATAYDLSSHERTWLENIDGFGVQTDLDIYRVDVPQGEENLRVFSQFSHANGDINLTVAGFVGGSFEVIERKRSQTDNEFINLVVPEAGTYYLGISGDNSGNTYNLIWDTQAPTVLPTSNK